MLAAAIVLTTLIGSSNAGLSSADAHSWLAEAERLAEHLPEYQRAGAFGKILDVYSALGDDEAVLRIDPRAYPWTSPGICEMGRRIAREKRLSDLETYEARLKTTSTVTACAAGETLERGDIELTLLTARKTAAPEVRSHVLLQVVSFLLDKKDIVRARQVFDEVALIEPRPSDLPKFETLARRSALPDAATIEAEPVDSGLVLAQKALEVFDEGDHSTANLLIEQSIGVLDKQPSQFFVDYVVSAVLAHMGKDDQALQRIQKFQNDKYAMENAYTTLAVIAARKQNYALAQKLMAEMPTHDEEGFARSMLAISLAQEAVDNRDWKVARSLAARVDASDVVLRASRNYVLSMAWAGENDFEQTYFQLKKVSAHLDDEERETLMQAAEWRCRTADRGACGEWIKRFTSPEQRLFTLIGASRAATPVQAKEKKELPLLVH